MAQNIYGGDVTSSGISGIPYVQDYQTFPSTFYPANFQPTSQAPPQPNSASSYADLKYLFGVQDTSLVSVNKSGRSRKRSGPGGEHVKHRRTRSGCYTCRTRRVKCDEKHPICERCKKGGRECVYPEVTTSSKGASSASKCDKPRNTNDSGSSSEDGETADEVDKMESILDEEEDEPRDALIFDSQTRPEVSSIADGATPRARESSEAPSSIRDKITSPTPSTEGSTGWNVYARRASSLSASVLDKSSNQRTLKLNTKHLPADLQFYLQYFYDNITYHHYSLKYDSCDFLRTIYLDAVLRNDALLHATVGFSAFQHTLANPQGKIEDFLLYYNKAVSLLLRSLQKGLRSTIGTLLTILQLATIEEYLGDWVNLLGHQRAAYEIITELFTPETILQSDLTRTILGWYARFDVFGGLMAGSEAVMSREWFSTVTEFMRQKIKEEPEALSWKMEEAVCTNRLIAMDMSILFSKMGKGEIELEEFVAENAKISRRLTDFQEKMDPALKDPKWLVKDFSDCRPYDPETDIVNPYMKDTLYHGPIWATNQLMIDWYSVELMQKYQTALITQTQPTQELAMNAYASCQLFEAVEYWPHSPKGSVLACQASLGISALFLPQDHQHWMWCRRKLAVIESQGYIYPLTFRTKMSGLFRDPSCMHWWLPDEEGYPPVVRSIRKFVEQRTSQATDAPGKDLYDMKAIFSSLKLDEPS